MWRNSTSFRLVLCVAASGLIVACATDKERLLPSGNVPMMDVWHAQTSERGGSLAGRKLLDARLVLRRPIPNVTENTGQYAFARLPNPDLVMYVFAHMAGDNAAPIPGYSTVFPMFGSVQYAMPGEASE